ncbi:MAG TPA: GspH/FimT family pseudopilin [Noviherbaspirillum sp.]|uniref:GspH/FimT family pseudopilin n=1 Tax=Noviherbaspirillum sp. TaxID=1926288 RepID=UPI002B461DFE|nr:GspH/FimT family pseudopilin [Noviherbaspirillum sp.]HJV85913.1 GspH/FimT family pseudopilin [Noviherbaspirillum sp.]
MNTLRSMKMFSTCTERSKRSGGFTLTELLVTMTISAILLGIGIPSFTSFIGSQGATTASHDVTSMLTLARSEAIKRNTNVVATPVSGDWKNGWTVDVTAGGTTTTLNKQAAYKGLAITSSVTSVTYGSNGRIQGSTVPTFEITGNSHTRCVKVTLSGLPNSKTGSCS